MLTLSAPALAVAALLIRLESHGHPIYRQRRVGRDGAPFELYKLRTMVSGAETMGAGLALDEGDSRITRLGAMLRRTSLDELPNLVNVLRGEMSIVGPRPTVQVQVDRYTERQRGRLSGQARADGLGAGPGPRLAAVGRADRARPLVRRARVARARPADPLADGPRWCSAATGSTRARRAAGGTRPAEPPRSRRVRPMGSCVLTDSERRCYCIDPDPPHDLPLPPKDGPVCMPGINALLAHRPRPSRVARSALPGAPRGGGRAGEGRRAAPRSRLRRCVTLADRVSPEPVERSRLAGRVTLQTIADALGVSRTTVSNAYNRPDQLAPELREQVLETGARCSAMRARTRPRGGCGPG